MTQQQRYIKRKLAALRYAEECGNVALTARRFGVSRQCIYVWKRRYEKTSWTWWPGTCFS